MEFLEYRPIFPHRVFEIQELYSVHYFEYAGTCAYPGECHAFWELLYVDKGALQVSAGERSVQLTQGQLIFHAPGEFHAFAAVGAPPDLVVAGFQCDSPEMEFFRGRTAFADAVERTLLARIITEASAAFSDPLDTPGVTLLRRAPNPPFGGEQLLTAALEELLIRLVRRNPEPELPPPRRKQGEDTFEQVAAYLEQRVDRPLTLEQVCQDNLVGRSQLQKLFHTHTGGGVMEYFGQLKIQAARRMIREGQLNFTQIAACLGFQSVHYFSRRFRLSTGMSPTEYARSVRMLSELPGMTPDNNANNL